MERRLRKDSPKTHHLPPRSQPQQQAPAIGGSGYKDQQRWLIAFPLPSTEESITEFAAVAVNLVFVVSSLRLVHRLGMKTKDFVSCGMKLKGSTATNSTD